MATVMQQLREAKGWTKAELALALGIRRETLSRSPYREELASFKVKLDGMLAQREHLDPAKQMGDAEWGTMHKDRSA